MQLSGAAAERSLELVAVERTYWWVPWKLKKKKAFCVWLVLMKPSLKQLTGITDKTEDCDLLCVVDEENKMGIIWRSLGKRVTGHLKDVQKKKKVWWLIKAKHGPFQSVWFGWELPNEDFVQQTKDRTFRISLIQSPCPWQRRYSKAKKYLAVMDCACCPN